ncbi:hydrogenase maturation nickel metallochaperone HypA/HybF [Chromobacterium paludis]|uniref:Hydrogenase maturation factor HypA n=1 Tax=Chromobacterium paludis TaxID=2605945 RepID=A0A5C1DHM3_9NEIS|nr:hydrogenase maturation nickel metallochaperone HypA [Chromobacterium paludis]QEL55128.1 hydrogenase maturation nickel metallochaperone HypA [Chromobacterium paludis]
MHELSLAEEILAIVEHHAVGLSAVTSIRLRVGSLAGVDTAALRFALETVLRGGKAEAAEIEIEETPARAVCRDCGLEQRLEERICACAACGALGLALICGDELQVSAIAGVD